MSFFGTTYGFVITLAVSYGMVYGMHVYHQDKAMNEGRAYISRMMEDTLRKSGELEE